MAVNNPYYRKMPEWGTENIKGYGDSSTYLDQRDPELFPSQERQGGQGNFGQYAQGISSGLAAGAANSQPVGDFNIDQYAGFKGSGEGLMGGGVIGAIVGGVSAQYGQFKKVNENLKNLDTSVQGVTYDAYGRPVYQGSNVVGAQANIGALNEGINKLNKTHLDPATNLISSFSGTRRRMKRKRGQLEAGIRQAQQEYNTADQRFRDQSIQRNEYLERMNSNRYYNLFS